MVNGAQGAFVLSCRGDCVVRFSTKLWRVFCFRSRTSGNLFYVVIFFIQFRGLCLGMSLLFISKKFLFRINVYVSRELAGASRLLVVRFIRVIRDYKRCAVIRSCSVNFASTINFWHFYASEGVSGLLVRSIRGSPVTISPAVGELLSVACGRTINSLERSFG